MYSLFIGLSDEDDVDRYEFLGSIIYQVILKAFKRVERPNDQIYIFLNYISKTIEESPFKRMSTTTPLQVLELKMYAKIMSLLKTKIFAKFRPKVLEICFQILEKQTPSVRLIKPTLSKKIKRRKQTTDFKLIDDIRDNRREEKGASSKGIPSLPSSPYKSENQEEMRNFGYFQLNQLKSDPQLKMEKEIRADVLGMLFTTLTWIKLENEKQEIGRTSSQMPFEFSFIEILTILRSRFKDNNLAINMTVGEYYIKLLFRGCSKSTQRD